MNGDEYESQSGEFFKELIVFKGVTGVYVAASTHCFSDRSFDEACSLIDDLEYDKVEIWVEGEGSNHLQPAEVAEDPDRFAVRFRELTRLTPIAITLHADVSPEVQAGISKAAKLLRVTQITVPASPLGTPFNTEIDRLREFVALTNQDGNRLSIKTEKGMLTEDPHTAVELCQNVPGLGLTLDISHYICGPKASESIDQIYPYVYHVHLRDTSAQEFQVPVGLGEIDYSRIINQLRREDYRLALSVELIPELGDEETRPLEMRKLRMLLESLL